MTDLNGITAKGEIKLLGVMGDPIAHSLSPALFAFLLKTLSLSGIYQYRAWRVPVGGLHTFMPKFRESAAVGLNVTIPHKERILPFLDGLDKTADILGAVNTIANEAGRLVGYNTDWIGFLRSLQARGISLAGRDVVVFGAGGAAKAIIYGLIQAGIQRVTIYNRTASRAAKLVQEIRAKTRFLQIYAADAPPEVPTLPDVLRGASLLINATPAGMYPAINESPLADPHNLHSGLIVYDLIYNPAKTELMKQAEVHGAQVFSGLDMLIYQALESLKLWLRDVERPAMRDAEALVPTLRERLICQLNHC